MVVPWKLIVHGLCMGWVTAVQGKTSLGHQFLKETFHLPCFLKLLSLGAARGKSIQLTTLHQTLPVPSVEPQRRPHSHFFSRAHSYLRSFPHFQSFFSWAQTAQGVRNDPASCSPHSLAPSLLLWASAETPGQDSHLAYLPEVSI